MNAKMRVLYTVFSFSFIGLPCNALGQEKCGNTTANDSAIVLLGKTLNRPAGGQAADAPLVATSTAEIVGAAELRNLAPTKPLGSIIERSEIAVRLRRPPTLDAAVWNQAYPFGAAETERRTTEGSTVAARAAGILTTIVERKGDDLILRLEVPPAAQRYSADVWSIVTVICDPKKDTILAYGWTKIKVKSSNYVFILTGFCILLFWLSITFASWQLNARKLQMLWEKKVDDYNSINEPKINPTQHLEYRRIFWKFIQATNPIFIAQDSLGYGSLSRFQILIFTTIVGAVLLYIFIHSNELTPVSDTILVLLGIMVVGGTFARATSDWYGLSPSTRRILLGESLIEKQLDKPRFSDLLETQGEIDVAKVQALLFTAIVSLGIISKGYSGLYAFELPPQFIYLLGISQGAYVLGKFVPTDIKQRIEQDFLQLRTTARELKEPKGRPIDELQSAFEQARNAASATLKEVFLERFKEVSFLAMGPERFASPVAAKSGS